MGPEAPLERPPRSTLLAGNRIGEAGGLSLAVGLRVNSKLQMLDFQKQANEVGGAGALDPCPILVKPRGHSHGAGSCRQISSPVVGCLS